MEKGKREMRWNMGEATRLDGEGEEEMRLAARSMVDLAVL
jgi:hypothetical protein